MASQSELQLKVVCSKVQFREMGTAGRQETGGRPCQTGTDVASNATELFCIQAPGKFRLAENRYSLKREKMLQHPGIKLIKCLVQLMGLADLRPLYLIVIKPKSTISVIVHWMSLHCDCTQITRRYSNVVRLLRRGGNNKKTHEDARNKQIYIY